MKIFTAIEVPEAAIKQIHPQIYPLIRDYPGFNWFPTQNYHINLHYVGDIVREKLPIAVEHIENTLYDVPVTQMYTMGCDLFMDEHIIIYLSFYRNKIVEDISNRLFELFEPGKKRKHDFIPHVSLARLKIPSKQQYLLLKKKLANLKVKAEFDVPAIYIYESIEKSKTPTYEKVSTIALLKE